MSKFFDSLYKFRWFVLIFLLAVIGISTFFAFSLKGQVVELIFQKKEAARPAEIDLIKITTPDCLQCEQVSGLFLRNLQRLNIKLASQKELSFGTKEAQELIAKFGIKKVPALILRGEVKKDAQLEKTLLSLGKEKQDSVVIEGFLAPYQKVDTKEIVGEFKLIYLTDESCSQCYDVKIHKQILASFGMFPFAQVSLDQNSSEGRQLINQYKITKLPTFLLQGDLEVYSRFQQVWQNVGKVTADGTYIFEALDQMGTYRDLEKNEIVQASQRQNQQQNQQAVHRHANFLVFLEGEQFDFAQDPQRYFGKDQGVHLEESTLQGAAGKVIHVEEEGITLRKFFGTLGWQLTNSCLRTDKGEEFCNQGERILKVFRNGEQDSSFGNQEIQDGDKYLITFGSESEAVIQQQIEQVPNFAF